MTHWSHQTFAALAAVLLTLTSISAIVTVPPAQAHAPGALPMAVELA